MLETIRAYAADRLDESGEADAFKEAHARFYLGLAEEANPEITGPDQEGWFERLDAEHETCASRFVGRSRAVDRNGRFAPHS